jgi:hypothetical protein
MSRSKMSMRNRWGFLNDFLDAGMARIRKARDSLDVAQGHIRKARGFSQPGSSRVSDMGNSHLWKTRCFLDAGRLGIGKASDSNSPILTTREPAVLDVGQGHIGRAAKRAMIAARLATLGAHRPKGGQLAGLPQSDAAKQLNVGERSVRRARQVLEHGAPDEKRSRIAVLAFGAQTIAFVVSANLRRRHLSPSQLAVLADELAQLRHGGDRKSIKAPIGALMTSLTQDQAADLVGASRRNTQRAREVREKGAPELLEAVKRGEVSLNAASQAVKLMPPEKQPRPERFRSYALTGAKPREVCRG